MSAISATRQDRQPNAATHRIAALGILAVCGAIAVTVWFLRREPSPEQALRSALHALENDHPDTLYDLMTNHEKKTLGISKDQFRAVFNEVIEPRMQSFQLLHPLKFFAEPTNADALATPVFEGPNGTKVSFFIRAARSEEGTRIYPLVSHIVLAVLASDQDWGTNEIAPYAWIRGLDAEQTKLEAAGLRGLIAEVSGGPQFFTWNEWRERCARTIALVEEDRRQRDSRNDGTPAN